MQIDVISDTICPWCFIGKRRLDRALAERPDDKFDVRWRPFRLNPGMPPEGMDRREYLAAKFGGDPRGGEVYQAIRAAGEAEDIAFVFDHIAHVPATTDSHRLIRWAATKGVQHAVVERLFQAYFIEGLDIGDPDVLCDVGVEEGMDRAILADLLAGEADRDLVEREDALARRIGVEGVPAFIFGGKYIVPGAQDPNVFHQVIDRVRQMSAAPA